MSLTFSIFARDSYDPSFKSKGFKSALKARDAIKHEIEMLRTVYCVKNPLSEDPGYDVFMFVFKRPVRKLSFTRNGIMETDLSL